MRYLLDGIETERLSFRLLNQGDFDTWMALFVEEDVSRTLGMVEIKSAYEQCKEWFKRAKHRYDNDLGGMNVLVDKNNKEFVGQSGLLIQEVDGATEMEVGFSILPKYWKNGYASEAAIKCRDYAFENNFVQSLICITHMQNHNAQKVALKMGMEPSKDTNFMNMPVKIFRIFRKDWKNLYI